LAAIPQAKLILRQRLIKRFGEDEAWSIQSAKALLFLSVIAFKTVEDRLRIKALGVVSDRLLPCLSKTGETLHTLGCRFSF